MLYATRYRYNLPLSGKIMHPAGKIFMGIGVFVILGGVLLMVIGGGNIEDAGETFEDIDEYKLERVTLGTLTITDSDGFGDLGFTFYIEGEYIDNNNNDIWDHCETTEITITAAPATNGDWDEGKNGDFYFAVNDPNCEVNDNNKDDSKSTDGLVKVGRACLACYAGNMSFESNTEVWVTYDDETIEEVIEGIGEGIFGAAQSFTGFLGVCCGVLIIIFGLVLGSLVNNEKQVVVQNNGMPVNNVMYQPNQTMMTQPTVEKSYADIPVQPQTKMEQPEQGSFWDQEEPKNPF